jgi:hypothetical protein
MFEFSFQCKLYRDYIVGSDDPQALVILAEEEIVAIDLVSEGWPTFPLPYLVSVHCSAITCTAHVTNVPKTLWDKMADAGRQQLENSSERVSSVAALTLNILEDDE